MLDKLIAELKKGNTTSASELARRLDTTPAMVEAMLDTLERHGIMKTIIGSNECSQEKPCELCSLAGLCTSDKLRSTKIRIFN